MVCWTCDRKGDHWTSKCPYKDLAPQVDAFVDNLPKETLASSGADKDAGGAYMPPNMHESRC